MRRRNERYLIKHVNKKSGSDIAKVISLVVVLMLFVSVILWYIGSVVNSDDRSFFPRPERSDATDNEIASYYNGEIPYEPAENITPDVALTGMNYLEYGDMFELPLNGTTGWAATRLPVRAEPSANAQTIVTMEAGRGFTILDGSGNWWYVDLNDGQTGWVDNRGCFINLPDIIPSMIFQNTNASGSIMVSLGYTIPGITGEVMYVARAFNYRLGREEYIVPGMYSLARSLFIAQQAALENGDTLIINEVFRPRATQAAVVQGMNSLMAQNSDVHSAITSAPWSLSWFISTGTSNHQRGAAVDASIGMIRTYEYRQTGDFVYRHVLAVREHIMPTCMHELSPRAAIFDSPRTITAAQMLDSNTAFSDNVTPGVRRLQRAFGAGGFTPLASEWWHFNHADSISNANSMSITGNFFTETIYSRPPVI